jgi:LmbE family N-acetylglucosaminyl deacetylase
VIGMDLGTTLGVWAHPDDETYLAAGLMAMGVDAGERVVCVTATRGEGGSLDEERWPSETMAEVREAELMRCLEILGVTEHVWLDLPDIDMDTPLPDVGYARVLDLMRDVQPGSVLTFGPDGMTGHAAHKTVSAWATRAFHEAAPAGARLYYATNTPEWAAEFVPIYNRFDIFRPGTPPVTPREELGIDLPLPPEILERKLRAIQAHESQVGGMVEAFGEDIFRRAMKEEYYSLAAEKGMP